RPSRYASRIGSAPSRRSLTPSRNGSTSRRYEDSWLRDAGGRADGVPDEHAPSTSTQPSSSAPRTRSLIFAGLRCSKQTGLPTTLGVGMRYTEAGGVRLSSIGLGCWQFGSRDWGYGKDYGDTTAVELVHAALDMGVNLIDTAEVYA